MKQIGNSSNQAGLRPQKTLMPIVGNNYFNNTKVANSLFDARERIPLDGTTKTVCVLPKADVSVGFSLTADPNVTLYSDVTSFDVAVMDAVCTLHEHDCDIFTPSMVVRVMTGNYLWNRKPNSKIIKDTMESLEKLMVILVRINLTDEFVERNLISRGSTAEWKSHLLSMSAAKVTQGNNRGEQEGFRLLEEPILYTYAKKIRQVVGVPSRLLGSNKEKYNTKETILIKRYLISRIEVMKNANNRAVSTEIIYERQTSSGEAGMFPMLGYQKENYSNWRKKKSAIHDTVRSILGEMEEKRYITGFLTLKSGNEIIGVKVVP